MIVHPLQYLRCQHFAYYIKYEYVLYQKGILKITYDIDISLSSISRTFFESLRLLKIIYSVFKYKLSRKYESLMLGV